MSIVTQRYTLGVSPGSNSPRIRCSMGDTARNIKLLLYDSDGLFSIPSGVSAVIKGTKSNNVGFLHSCIVGDSYVIFTIVEDMSDIPGIVICEIQLTDSNGGIIGTSNFVIQVENAALSDDSVIGEVDADIITGIITDIEVYKSLVNKTVSDYKDETDQAIAGLRATVGNDVAGIRDTVTNAVSVLTARMDLALQELNKHEVQTVLFDDVTNPLTYIGDTATLEADPTTFDYIDFYYKTHVNDSGQGNWDKVFRFEPNSLFPTIVSVQPSDASASNKTLYVHELSFNLSGTTITVLRSRRWYWSGNEGNSAAIQQSNGSSGTAPDNMYGGRVYKIVGVNISDIDELTDLRIGTDGTVYQSAGTAVRTQLNRLNSKSASDIPYSNTNSGLSATNVQEAIDENTEELAGINGRLQQEVPKEIRDSIASVNPKNTALKLCDYTVSDGAYNGTTKTYSTGNVVYKHTEYVLGGESMLFIGGYSYSQNYLAYYFLDSDGNIISAYDKYADYGQSHEVAEIVKVPENAYKVVVNFRIETADSGGGNARPAFLYTYANKKIYSADVKTGLLNIGGKITYGLCYSAKKAESANGAHVYRRIAVSGGETLYITGFHYSDNFPFCFMLDADDNVTYIPEKMTTNTVVTARMVNVPANARTVIVNGRMDRKIYPVAYKVTESTGTSMQEFDKDLRKESVELVSTYPSVSYGNIKKKDGTMSDYNDVYVMCEKTVTGGETYYVSGYYTSDNWPLYLFENADGDICETGVGQFSASTKYFNIKVIAPLDAVKLYVNGRNVSEFDIKIEKPVALADTLRDRCGLGIYDGRTPVQDIISDASKAERNLSKFSYAYGVMLHRIMSTYPNAIVICCSCNECERKTFELGMPERNEHGETIADYNAVIERLAKAFGAFFVDHHSCGITYYNVSQYVVDYDSATGFSLHPNAAGMELIAQRTIKDLNGMDFTGKKLSVFGDSISTFNGTGSTNNEYPIGNISNVNQMWWHISCIQHFGMTLLNNGSGGGRSVSTIREGMPNYPKSGCNQDAIDNLAVNGVSPDVILIKQGINDFGNTGSASNKDLNGKNWFGGLGF